MIDMLHSTEISFRTRGEIDIIDLTSTLEAFVQESGVSEGILHVFHPGSTGALTFIEYEHGVLDDFRRMLNEIVPKGAGWKHDRIDDNAHSHLRASLIGQEITIPIEDGRLITGTWQQPVFVELDVTPRSRRLLLKAIGEPK